MRMQYLIAIEVNLSQSYLDSKLSTIEPQSCGLQKKISSIVTGFYDSENGPFGDCGRPVGLWRPLRHG